MEEFLGARAWREDWNCSRKVDQKTLASSYGKLKKEKS